VRALLKLLLGETRALPLGVALVVVLGLVLRAAGGGWWEHAGGFVLRAAVVATLAAALRRP
jgi:hypothetical protein